MIQPLETKILIKPEPFQTERNGIIVPQNNRQRTGEVLAIGDDVDSVKVGDRVEFLFKNYIMDEENILIDEENVLFVYEAN